MTFDVIPIHHETWLICGSRDFTDQEMFNSAMGDLVQLKGMPSKVIHGGYRGADTMADEWGKRHALEVHAEKADWDTHGPAAGPIRNQTMLDEFSPTLVVAFPGSRGTADMITKARAAGVDVAEIYPHGVIRLP